MEREVLTTTNKEEIDAMMDELLVCESHEPSIPLNTMDDVNIAENADTVCFVDPDPPIFPSTSRSVTESIVLKLTKKTVTFSDGIAENVRETKISKSKTYCKRP